MRAIYKTSRHAARSGARAFDVGVLNAVQATAPECDDVMKCILGGPLADDSPTKDVADVKFVDENGDSRFEFDCDKVEALALAQFFDSIARELR